MSGFDLPNNYTDNLEALLRKNRSHTASSFATPLVVELVTTISSATIVMAKSLRVYSIPAVSMCLLVPLLTRVPEILSYALASLRWCRQTNSMVCQVRTQMCTCSTS